MKKDFNATIATKLRKLRELRGYSQENMADAVALSPRQYQRIEAGETEISLSKLERLCVALDISPDQLLGFDEQFFFENCTHNTGMGKATINQFPEKLIKAYQEQIEVLKNELAFIKELLRSNIKS